MYLMPRKDKIYSCSYEGCAAVFSKPNRYEIHVRVHTGERPFLCAYDDCGKSYTNASHLQRHEDTAHEEFIRCPIKDCTIRLKSKTYLQKHLDTIHKKKSKAYKCSHCNESFSKHSWLKQHLYKHTNILPFSCPKEDCNKRFLYPSRLKRHMKIHNGYPCGRSNCNEVLPNWSLYVKHIKVAHPMILKCSVCGKQFSRSFNLFEHERTHTSEKPMFHCTEPNCERFYYAKKNLMSHLKDFHEARPYKCNEQDCPQQYRTEAQLKDHERYHNPNIPLPRKKRKKKNTVTKPRFAERLAGCVAQKKRKRRTSSNESKSPPPNSDSFNVPGNLDKLSSSVECSEKPSHSEIDKKSDDGAIEMFEFVWNIKTKGNSPHLDTDAYSHDDNYLESNTHVECEQNLSLPVAEANNIKEDTSDPSALAILESMLNGESMDNSSSEISDSELIPKHFASSIICSDRDTLCYENVTIQLDNVSICSTDSLLKSGMSDNNIND